MRNMLAFMAAVALTVIGVGWYLGWFQLHSVPAESGHRTWTVDVNTDKLTHDMMTVEKNVQQKIEEKSKANAAASSATAALPKQPEPVKQTDSIKPVIGAALRRLEGPIEQPGQ
jgi:hypothetical protein